MILFHQTMKEYGKPHIVEEDTKEGTDEDTIKGEDTSNLKFNAIIEKKNCHYVYEFRSVAHSMERKTNYVGKKIKDLLYCWHIKYEVRRKIHNILTSMHCYRWF